MEKSYKKHLTVDPELEFYERKVREMMDSLDATKYNEIVDREGWKDGPKGGRYKTVVSTVEQIKKDYRDTLERFPKMLDNLDNLRNKYKEKEFIARGNVEMKNTGLDFAKKFAKEEDDNEHN